MLPRRKKKRGRYRSLPAGGLETAEQYFSLALANDSTYAAPWAGISRVWIGRQQM